MDVPGRDGPTGVVGWSGDGDGDDFADRFEAGFGVVGDSGLHIPLALAAGADVLLAAAELELGAAGHQ
jgi:hypothetical protein